MAASQFTPSAFNPPQICVAADPDPRGGTDETASTCGISAEVCSSTKGKCRDGPPQEAPMKVEVGNDWASARTQELVRNNFPTMASVVLEFSKENQHPIRLTAKTAHVLSGEYNEFIDASSQKGFAITVCAAYGVGSLRVQSSHKE
jgi:hypothetical protein